ncbi:MAG: family 43 glycosylhydrolase [Bacteroidaceae bacterium]|nr:family 43 glycosylhydrolase [Bacteroidaceae bacterium]
MKRISTLAAVVCAYLSVLAQNPYMPLWEYIPDGEPYVFEDPDKPGQYRVYVYGSHDNEITAYCGRDQVVWSAPVNNLSDWRYDGIIFKSQYGPDGNLLDSRTGRGDILYAPDIATVRQADGSLLYYLYPNNQSGGRQSQVCVSDRPDGPFKVCNWNAQNPRRTDGILGFDPAVFVDDDGRVYGYWGFEESNGAELDPETMASVKPGTEIVRNMVSDYRHDGVFRFFEASSMRKIQDKYVFIYSRYTADGEDGLPASNNTLAYAYSDSPLGPFTYGGTIIDARGPQYHGVSGEAMATANRYGNTHGSIVQIDGQWWVFYHRQTGTDQFSRQAMVAPITVKVQKGKGGKVEISRAEVTSEGFQTDGLDPTQRIAAGWACWFDHPSIPVEQYPNFIYSGSYVQPTRLEEGSYQGPYNMKEPFCPLVNNTNGSTVGFKYLNFDKLAKKKTVNLEMRVKLHGESGTVRVMVDDPTGKGGARVVAQFRLDSTKSSEITTITTRCFDDLKGIKGKRGLYFAFDADRPGQSLCDFYDFRFF